jgi:hypothetical protein
MQKIPHINQSSGSKVAEVDLVVKCLEFQENFSPNIG